MNILIVNRSDVIGAGAPRAAYRLYRGLKEAGVNVRYLVSRKTLPDVDIIRTDPMKTLRNRLFYEAERYFLKKCTPYSANFSANLLSSNLHKMINRLDVDLVHFHWMCGNFFNFRQLHNINKPIVWSMHDMWLFTGGCHYNAGCTKFETACSRCPMLESRSERDLSYMVYSSKARSIRKTERLTIVGLSRWMAGAAEKSPLLKGKDIVHIPNPINTSDFKPVDSKIAKNILNLPLDRKIILFGAVSPNSDKRKGYKLLLEALNALPERDRFECVVIGRADNSDPLPGITSMGFLEDTLSLRLVYSAADVFVLPSLQENLSNMIMEALACGTPVACFDIGGNSDMVMHQENGYLARPMDSADLAMGIEWVLESRERIDQLSRKARKIAVTRFDVKTVTKTYLDLYERILNAQ